MKIIAITLAAIVALSGAAGVANATGNDNGCKKSGNSYVCSPPGTETYTFNTATSEADASAKLEAFLNNQQSQNQGQAQGQVATGGDATATSTNTNQNVNGGNTVSIDNSTPKFTSSANLNVGIGLNATILQGVEHNNAKIVADWFAAHGKPCLGMQVMLNTPQGRKLGVQADCTGQVVSK